MAPRRHPHERECPNDVAHVIVYLGCDAQAEERTLVLKIRVKPVTSSAPTLSLKRYPIDPPKSALPGLAFIAKFDPTKPDTSH